MDEAQHGTECLPQLGTVEKSTSLTGGILNVKGGVRNRFYGKRAQGGGEILMPNRSANIYFELQAVS